MGSRHENEDLIEEILNKIPRPYYDELWALYNKLDNMTRRVGRVLVNSDLYECDTTLIRFDKADEKKIINLILKDSDVMVPFFVMICGFSDRELGRKGISNIYALRKHPTSTSKIEKLRKFAEVVAACLTHPLKLETLLYKFYKNWEEHQRRHIHGHKVEQYIAEELRKRGIQAGKIKIQDREIDCAIPPDPKRVKIAIQIRTGVRKDLVKRAKEFSSELDELTRICPDIKFVALYVSRDRDVPLSEIYEIIKKERQGKRPYDAVITAYTPEEALEELIGELQRLLKAPHNGKN